MTNIIRCASAQRPTPPDGGDCEQGGFMKLRKLRLIAVPVAAAIMLMGSVSPAEAAGSGVGVVSGAVQTSPGVPTDPTAPAQNNNVTFVSTAIVGAVTVDTCAFAGTIDVDAEATATDTTHLGTGLVTSLTGNGTTGALTIDVDLANDPLFVLGTKVENTFVRLGTTVTVVLALNVTINGPLTTCTDRVTAVVEAEFVPNSTSGETPPQYINGALFAGVFTVVGAP